MKKFILTACCFFAGTAAMFAQTYMTRTGRISFNATNAKSPEKIEAINNEVACIVNGKSGELVFQLPVMSFKFERELMKEHFNENYMESSKYPKSEFRGKVENLADVNFAKDGTYNVKTTGKLTIHGVTNDVTVPGTMTVKGKSLTLKTKFPVKLADYKITIPGLVADKLAKEAAVTLDSELAQK